MIGHQELNAVGNQNLRCRHALRLDRREFLHKRRNVKRDTVADHVGDILGEHARRQEVQRKSAVVVDNRVTRVCTALVANHNVRILCEHVRNLTLAFIAPVGADNCFD